MLIYGLTFCKGLKNKICTYLFIISMRLNAQNWWKMFMAKLKKACLKTK